MMLIGLTGPVGVGKTTVAIFLCDKHGFRRVFHAAHIAAALDILKSTPGVVFEPLYLAHEANAIRLLDGQVWHIQRPGYLTHPGDRIIAGVIPAGRDRGILNDGSISTLYDRVDKLLNDLRSHADQTPKLT